MYTMTRYSDLMLPFVMWQVSPTWFHTRSFVYAVFARA